MTTPEHLVFVLHSPMQLKSPFFPNRWPWKYKVKFHRVKDFDFFKIWDYKWDHQIPVFFIWKAMGFSNAFSRYISNLCMILSADMNLGPINIISNILKSIFVYVCSGWRLLLEWPFLRSGNFLPNAHEIHHNEPYGPKVPVSNNYLKTIAEVF